MILFGTSCVLLATLLAETNGYVLVQVRKGENQSNVDALIHKVLPSDKFDKIAKTARKQFNNYKQIKVKNTPHDDELESIVFAINTATDFKKEKKNESYNKVDKLTNQIIGFLKKYFIDATPNFRTKMREYNIKPELVNFKSGKKSVLYEINLKSIMRTIRDFLSSRTVKKYADNMVQKAAIIFRTIKDELNKEKPKPESSHFIKRH